VPKARPLAMQLAFSHGLIGLLACFAVGSLLALLLPEVYLRQRQKALVAVGQNVAAQVAPALERGVFVQALLVGGAEVSSLSIIDAHGRVMATLTPPGQRGRGLGLGGAPHAVARLDALWRDRWEEVRSGKVVEGSVLSPEHGPVFVAAVPVKGEQGVIGAVIVYARLTDLRDAAIALLPLVALASLLVAAIAVAAGSWLSARMARPLRRMTEVAGEVSQGNLALSVEAPAWAEGEALARAFNQMTESLAAHEASRRQFVADASHQLRAPLTSLQAQAEALLDGVVQDEATRQRFLARIVEDAKGLSALAQELLDLERLESGPKAPQREPLDLGALLHDVAEAFSADGPVSVIAETPPDLPPARADRSEVRQALVNLVSNAVKYSPPGGEVRLTAHASGSAIRISVADDGPGLAPEHLPLVWERFYRVPGDETRGSGLGLPIAKRLVERQEGCVGVDSAPGAGSTFWFDLPIAEAG
jgi:signal transduction histidine kinase